MTSRSTGTDPRPIVADWVAHGRAGGGRLFAEHSVVEGAEVRWRTGSAPQSRAWTTRMAGLALDPPGPNRSHLWTDGLDPRRLDASEQERPYLLSDPRVLLNEESRVLIATLESARAGGAKEVRVQRLYRCRQIAGGSEGRTWDRTDHALHLVLRVVTERGESRIGTISLSPSLPSDVERLAPLAIHAADAEQWKGPERVDVVFLPRAAGRMLHEWYGHPSEADWPGARPEPVDALAGLIDRATDWTPDDEGTPGVDVNLGSGERLRMLGPSGRSSGNGRRQDYSHPILPRMRHLWMPASTTPLDDLSVGTDIIAEQVTAAHVDPERAIIDLAVVGVRVAEAQGDRVRMTLRLPLDGRGGQLDGVGDRSESHLARCLKHGQVVSVRHTCPAIRMARLEVVS